jgi:hypothetical protein
VRWGSVDRTELSTAAARGSLQQPAAPDIEELARTTQPTCPFCAERIERETPLFQREVNAAGRFRVGEAVFFPNLVPYAKWNGRLCLFA